MRKNVVACALATVLAGSCSYGQKMADPFVSYNQQEPGRRHHITVADLPEPYATGSADSGSRIVHRPDNAWPKAPAGFKVELYADGLTNPRLIRSAPNGDVFLAESRSGEIKVFRGITPEGKAQQVSVFATGLAQPFGIAFYPPGPNPQWVYVGNTDSVVRFPYANGDLKARGAEQHIADLPGGGRLRGGGHWTRDIAFSTDGKRMFVSVGSHSNDDDTDNNRAEFHRADVLEFTPEGKNERVYASGIRNCVGIAVHPETNEVWCSVNERDELGNNLVPDYITHVREGGFYGWPWYYLGGRQDPRHKGKHPELKDTVITPDVLLQPHYASLEMAFYPGSPARGGVPREGVADGRQFPSEYAGNIFAAEHGSWNRSPITGYEVVRIRLDGKGRANGEYEDFLTGFVTPDGQVWGRPVGVTVAKDGSLLVSDDGSRSIWRVSYTGTATGRGSSKR